MSETNARAAARQIAREAFDLGVAEGYRRAARLRGARRVAFAMSQRLTMAESAGITRRITGVMSPRRPTAPFGWAVRRELHRDVWIVAPWWAHLPYYAGNVRWHLTVALIRLGFLQSKHEWDDFRDYWWSWRVWEGNYARLHPSAQPYPRWAAFWKDIYSRLPRWW